LFHQFDLTVKTFLKYGGNTMIKKELKSLILISALGTLALSLNPLAAMGKPRADDSLDINALFSACQNATNSTEADNPDRLQTPLAMWCAVVDREGRLLDERATDTGEKASANMNTDAWRASIEIAAAKAYTAVSVSSDRLALTSEDVGKLSQPGEPLWGVGNTNPYRPGEGNENLKPDDSIGKKHHGIVTFGGGVPIYDCTSKKLLGAVGVSGDAVPVDIAVATDTVTAAGYCTNP
jgi:uncharacterized protein GlcG (DUF336 family)